MTITDKKAVINALKNGGRIEGLEFPLIYQQNHGITGKRAYALFESPEFDDMDNSPSVGYHVCLMANGMRTVDGTRFLEIEDR